MANPNKTKPIQDILLKNKDKLVDFLTRFHADRTGKQLGGVWLLDSGWGVGGWGVSGWGVASCQWVGCSLLSVGGVWPPGQWVGMGCGFLIS